MKAKLETTPEPVVVSKPAKYHRLVRAERNMFNVETVIIDGDKIVSIENSESTFLPIAFDKLRRATGEAFFTAVHENQ